jgi:hypothetical protein
MQSFINFPELFEDLGLIRILTTFAVLLTLCGISPQVLAGFWGVEDGQCSVISSPSPITWLSAADVSVATEVAVDSSPCVSPNTAADPASAVCFEDAGNPISTIPELLAAMQAERAVSHVLNTLRAATQPAEPTLSSVQPAIAPVLVLARPLRLPTQECSSFEEQCGPQDPIPATLMLELSRATAVSSLDEFQPPTYPVVVDQGDAYSDPGLPDHKLYRDVEAPPPRAI